MTLNVDDKKTLSDIRFAKAREALAERPARRSRRGQFRRLECVIASTSSRWRP